MSHYKPYPTYKDSGVEWIGPVPEHWEVKRIKFAISSCQNGVWGDEPIGSNATPCVRVADFDRGALRVNQEIPTLRSIPERDRVSRLLRRGNLLLEKSGGGERQTVGQVVLYDQDTEAVCSNFVARIVLAHKSDPSFWCYQFAGAYACGLNLRSVKQTSGIQNLDQEQYLDEIATSPPPSEQSAIAAALDRETKHIDALIAKKIRFIELLKEKRQALITHAVTKGLDPNVKMKDSGVTWIGGVPEHWEVSKLAYTTQEAGGKTPDTKNEAYWGGDVPWISPKDMKRSEIFGAIDTISDTAVQEYGMRLFAPGTILAVVRGMILAHSFPVATLAVPATINQDMKAMEPDSRIRANYLRLVLEAAKDYVVSVLVAEAAHGTRVLRTDVWRQLPALLPPLDEQDAILAELDRIAARYDKLTERVEGSITLLKERRSALITAAVTGQIDLREEAA